MSSLDTLIGQIFEGRGYAVDHGPDGATLVASAPRERLLVAWAAHGPATAEDVRRAADRAERQGLNRAILVAPHGAPAHAEGAARDAGVELWRRPRVAVELGEWLLATGEANATGAAEPPQAAHHAPRHDGPAGGTDAEVIGGGTAPPASHAPPHQTPATPSTPPAPTAPVAPASPPAPEPPTAAPAAPAHPAAAPGQAPGAGAGTPGAGPVLRPRVDREEATAEAQPKLVRVTNAALELVPHHAYAYTIATPDGGGSAEPPATGTLLVNAQTGDALTLDAPQFADERPGDARVLDERIAADRAAKTARTHLERAHTRNIRNEEEEGDVAIVTTRKFRPRGEDLQLEARGVWYLPVWRLRGENGSMRIHAHTGEVVEEHLEKIAGTDAEWV